MYLDVQGNDITSFDDLKIHSNSTCLLKHLNISCNPLSDNGGLQFATSLSRNRNLTSLFINDCNFNIKSLTGITTSLVGNRVLSSLEIDRPLVNSTNNLSYIDHLTRVLSNRSCYFTNLSMKYNGLQDEGVRLISTSLESQHHMLQLNFECNSICTAGAEALASLIIYQERLKRTWLDENPAQGMDSHQGVDSRHYINILKLSNNIVSDEGAIALAEVKQHFNSSFIIVIV